MTNATAINRVVRPELIAGLASHSVTTVSDALDILGHNGGCEGITPVCAGMRLVGSAYTVLFEPVAPGQPAPAANYLDEVPPGSVVVLDNGGRTYCTVWGDLLSTRAKVGGVAGTVIFGACRDTPRYRNLDHPVFSLGRYMKSGKNRVRMVAAGVPVHLAGLTVHPGDVVLGDDDGVLVVPAGLAEEALKLAFRIEAVETSIREDLLRGVPIQEARRANGYDEATARERR